MTTLRLTVGPNRDAGPPLSARALLQEERWPTRTLEPITVQNYRPSTGRATRGYEYDQDALDNHSRAIREEMAGNENEKRWLIDGIPSYGNDNLQVRSAFSLWPDLEPFYSITEDPAHRHPLGHLIVYIEPTWDARHLDQYERMLDHTPAPGMGLIQFSTMISHIEAPYIQFSALDLFAGLLAREPQAFGVLHQLIERENVLPRPSIGYAANHYYVRHLIVKSLQLDPLDPTTEHRNGVTAIEMIVAIRWSDPYVVHIVSARPLQIDDNYLMDFSQYKIYDPQDLTFNSVARYFQRIDQGWNQVWATDVGVDLGQPDIWQPQQSSAQITWNIYCDHIRRTARIDVIPDEWWDMSLRNVRVRNIRYLSLDVPLFNEIPQRQIWNRHRKLQGHLIGESSHGSSDDGSDGVPYQPDNPEEDPVNPTL